MTQTFKKSGAITVTMRDVARAANVSQSTVCRILSPGNSDSKVQISEETRDKVLAIVKELGYHPKQYARSLRGKKTHMIANSDHLRDKELMFCELLPFLCDLPTPDHRGYHDHRYGWTVSTSYNKVHRFGYNHRRRAHICHMVV